jgi:hypothetical protein
MSHYNMTSISSIIRKPQVVDQSSVLSTMLIYNKPLIDSFIGNETLVVCGSARGMTSLVAYTLYSLDYFIGERIGSINYEDRDIKKAMPNVRGEHNIKALMHHDPFLQLVASRNYEHARWGFKLPYATFYIDQLRTLLRNPVFVICVRNPVAVARSSFQKHPDKNFTFETLFGKGIRPIRAIEKLMHSEMNGLIILDMDEVRAKPDRFLAEFTKLLQIEADTRSIESAIADASYKESPAKQGVTFIKQR